MLVYAPGWSLASQFWSYPPQKKFVFPRPKNWKFPPKTAVPDPIFFWKFWRFTVFAAKILSRRSRLSRWSRAPSRLIRPRPIDCDRGPKQRVKIFPVFGFELCQKNKFFHQEVHDRILIYTPKEAHSRIFVTGGSVIAWQMLAEKKSRSWLGELVGMLWVHRTKLRTSQR